MKKCPTCEKTFEDHLRFCQTDGTPLVATDEGETIDPLKTMIASQSDLPGLTDDPLKTVVGGTPAPTEEPANDADVLELAEQPEVESFDPLKTMLASDFQGIPKKDELDAAEDDDAAESHEVDTPPPSPFDEPISAEPESASSEGLSPEAPEPPRFSEPDISAPVFPGAADEPPAAPVSETEEPSAVESDAGAVASAESEAETKNIPAQENDFSSASPFGDVENTPIPSPFGNAQPSGYQQPSTPIPTYQEPDPAPPQANPFGETFDPGQPASAMEWSPPSVPASGWQDQQFGEDAPSQPGGGRADGQDQTLAIVSLVLGIASIVLCLGFVAGIPALITGFIARKRISESPAQYGGNMLAMIGMIVGGIGVALSLIGLALWIVLVVMSNI